MVNVFYTNREFGVGREYDTRGFCGDNWRHLDSLPPVHRDVEGFLEEVRRENYPDLPERFCSILAVPWPEFVFAERRTEAAVRAPDPPDGGRYCYYVSPAPSARTLLADEAYVEELVRLWPDVGGTHEKWPIAVSYWEREILRGYNLLIHGPFRVDGVCRGAEAPVVPKVYAEYPPGRRLVPKGRERMRRPGEWG